MSISKAKVTEKSSKELRQGTNKRNTRGEHEERRRSIGTDATEELDSKSQTSSPSWSKGSFGSTDYKQHTQQTK